ncbi:hypothetical protein D9M69_719100 [compost metagenome]
MNLHGDFAEIQFGGDLLVHQARHDEAHDFAFASRKRLIGGAQRSQGVFCRNARTILGQSGCDRVQHVLIAEGLG